MQVPAKEERMPRNKNADVTLSEAWPCIYQAWSYVAALPLARSPGSSRWTGDMEGEGYSTTDWGLAFAKSTMG